MLGVNGRVNSLEFVLGELVKKWETVLPEAVRALEKFNRENDNVLLKTGDEKAKILYLIKLKAFQGTESGQRLDLSIYKQPYEPLSE